eukprot:364793-Chlamydomonas_euryale.AAC.6
MDGWVGGWMDGWMDGWVGDVARLGRHERLASCRPEVGRPPSSLPVERELGKEQLVLTVDKQGAGWSPAAKAAGVSRPSACVRNHTVT